jgi:hypothetical protein
LSPAPAAARLTADDLRQLPPPSQTPAGCACAALVCPGWESVSAPPGEPLLQHLGTLRDAKDEDPTLTELHEGGTRYESPQAPIAPDFFPFNRCEVWACRACGRGFLQYTEFGGYYVDHRLREVDPRWVR